MKKYILSIFLSASFGLLYAQIPLTTSPDVEVLFKDKPEIYISFTYPGKTRLAQIGSYLSLDHNPLRNGEVFAYANAKTIKRLIADGIVYKVLPSPGERIKPIMKSFQELTIGITKTNNSTACGINWNFYPTYSAYEALMQQFEADFPDFCDIDTLAVLPSGRRILVAHLGDNLDQEEDEPEFLYTSSMHGDETAGYNLTLHLIAYLLCNNGTDPEVTRLLNEVDIYINPLANPDGAYASGNNSVFGATRSNALGFDLNRNYPDPDDGENPGGNHQLETLAFMDFAADRDFNISANLHGGAEVANYPWDTYFQRHADDAWWQYVCRNYANSAQENGPNGFFNDLNNGITNGYDWYIISGGRQDYMNAFEHCREFTLELSNNKILASSSLETYWGYHKEALLDYMKEALNGLRGMVTDSLSGEALDAKVFIAGHDKDSSHVYTSMPVGNYHRYLAQNTYSVTFSAEGYFPKTIDNIQIQNGTSTRLDVQLLPENVASIFKNQPDLSFRIFPNPAQAQIEVEWEDSVREIELTILDLTGRTILTQGLQHQHETYLDISKLSKGLYLLKVSNGNRQGIRKFLKN